MRIDIARAAELLRENQLAAAGKVLKISNPNGADRFDGNIVHHNHAVCSCCGRMFDIMVPLPDVCA